MKRILIKKNQYMDSLALMLLSSQLNEIEGVAHASVMMATPGNKDILRAGGIEQNALDAAGASDMVIALEASETNALDAAEKTVSDLLAGNQKEEDHAAQYKTANSWDGVEQAGADYRLCVLSIPGEYAAEEAARALELQKHVFLFSDHITLAQEADLKTAAREKGLLMMGADCGTAIIGGVPLGFANAVRSGRIGLIGASGTGMQEIMVRLHCGGQGISHAIGVGGRDLSQQIGGLAMCSAIEALAADMQTDVLVVVSKPPARTVQDKMLALLRGCGKPVVIAFLGEEWHGNAENLYFAPTLQCAADTAAALCAGEKTAWVPAEQAPLARHTNLMGLYSGGTLAAEAAWLTRCAVGLSSAARHENGCMLQEAGHEIWDLGDDAFTKGRPHPMIDATTRVRQIQALQDDPRNLLVLLDVVLGYGAADDPAGDLASAIAALTQSKRGGCKTVVVNLVGTEQDPQGLTKQAQTLERAGAHVLRGNSEAVSCALQLLGYAFPRFPVKLPSLPAPTTPEAPGEQIKALLAARPGIVNAGIKSFLHGVTCSGAKLLHFNWKPRGEDARQTDGAMRFLQAYAFPDQAFSTLEQANRMVADRILAAKPALVDVVPAAEMAEVLKGRTLLHAGPPLAYAEMTPPMQGSCVGAVLFEGWAQNEMDARTLLESGGVQFVPCHHVGFVGPMGGITSGSMPVLKVVNRNGGNVACCTLNEGIGPVLRFGAYSPDVIERLRFLRDLVAPTLSLALRELPEGLDVGVMAAKAIAMGDEFHQRNIAASMVFLKEIAPIVAGLEIGTAQRRQTLAFLAGCEQFFLNIMMAAAKTVMDYAAQFAHGTVVTAMTRNGKSFAIRIAGMGDEWFCGEVNTPEGLYFSGFSADDANPDMGDSAITETFGVGGMAMIAAPAVTRYVGSGDFYDALATSEEMAEICVGHNPQLPIPTWNFQGACLGIDACKVVRSGITPVINTGIAHKKAGLGQIGAGTVHPPMICFTSAVRAYACSLGYQQL